MRAPSACSCRTASAHAACTHARTWPGGGGGDARELRAAPVFATLKETRNSEMAGNPKSGNGERSRERRNDPPCQRLCRSLCMQNDQNSPEYGTTALMHAAASTTLHSPRGMPGQSSEAHTRSHQITSDHRQGRRPGVPRPSLHTALGWPAAPPAPRWWAKRGRPGRGPGPGGRPWPASWGGSGSRG